jgi:hypothetical protein
MLDRFPDALVLRFEQAPGTVPEFAWALRDFCDGVRARDTGLGAVTGD